ncbi:uncharacterized protein LOC135385385 [Ornithodoros turicata]|uniref:uncharacterized protein LOC135385385 n=1 Tax=Ornithodoros turicata TaxID=34597 RepID=UPI0031392DFA
MVPAHGSLRLLSLIFLFRYAPCTDAGTPLLDNSCVEIVLPDLIGIGSCLSDHFNMCNKQSTGFVQIGLELIKCVLKGLFSLLKNGLVQIGSLVKTVLRIFFSALSLIGLDDLAGMASKAICDFSKTVGPLLRGLTNPLGGLLGGGTTGGLFKGSAAGGLLGGGTTGGLFKGSAAGGLLGGDKNEGDSGDTKATGGLLGGGGLQGGLLGGGASPSGAIFGRMDLLGLNKIPIIGSLVDIDLCNDLTTPFNMMCTTNMTIKLPSALNFGECMKNVTNLCKNQADLLPNFVNAVTCLAKSVPRDNIIPAVVCQIFHVVQQILGYNSALTGTLMKAINPLRDVLVKCPGMTAT